MECVRQNWSYCHLVIIVCFPYIEGTTQENLDKLIQNVQIESDSDMIKNWKYLDVPVISSVRMCLFIYFVISYRPMTYSSFSNS